MSDTTHEYVMLWPALTDMSRAELREIAYAAVPAPIPSPELVDDLVRLAEGYKQVPRSVAVENVLMQDSVESEPNVAEALLDWVRKTDDEA